MGFKDTSQEAVYCSLSLDLSLRFSLFLLPSCACVCVCVRPRSGQEFFASEGIRVFSIFPSAHSSAQGHVLKY